MTRIYIIYFFSIFSICSCNSGNEEVRKTYYENGNVEVEYSVLDGQYHGETKFYYNDGTLKSIVNYLHGKEDGEYKTYHPNGILKMVSFYDEGVKVDTTKIFDEEKRLIELQVYDQRGVLNYFEKYDEHGNLRKDAMTPLFYPRIDTIKKGKEYRMEIRLANKVLPKTKVIVGPITDDGYLSDTMEVLQAKDNDTFIYTIKPEKTGTKIFSGIIDNYRESGDSTEIYTFPFSFDFTVVEK